ELSHPRLIISPRRPPRPTLLPYTTLFRSRDQAGALRRRARPGDQLPRDADLQDDLVRLQQRRARGEPLRARRVRQHLHAPHEPEDRKSTRLNSSHVKISYAVFCLKKKKKR